MIGKILTNRYRLMRQLGEGGMATVFLARDEKLGRKVAVKILHPHLAQNTDLRFRFQKEAQACSLIDDPYIVRIYDYSGEEKDELWFVTEFIKGWNLADIMQKFKHKKVHPLLSCILIKEVTRALKKAHQVDIVHRDIKPENIMLTYEGQIKLMDFGIAKDMQNHSMTMTGTMMGSPSYMSPEQIRNRGVDHRSDIYSLGIVFYELITGKVPFEGISTHDVASKIIEGKFRRPSRLFSALPTEIEKIILMSMASSVNERYQVVEEMEEAISQYCSAQKIQDTKAEIQKFCEDPGRYKKVLYRWSVLYNVPFDDFDVENFSPVVKEDEVENLRISKASLQKPPTAKEIIKFNSEALRKPIVIKRQAQVRKSERLVRRSKANLRQKPTALHYLVGAIFIALVVGTLTYEFLNLQEEIVQKTENILQKTVPVLPKTNYEQKIIQEEVELKIESDVKKENRKINPVREKTSIVQPKTEKTIFNNGEVKAKQKSFSLSSISITSQPASEIFVDGRSLGSSLDEQGRSRVVNIPSGSHKLSLQRSGYKTLQKNFNIDKGDHKKFSVTLSKEKELFPLTILTSETPVFVVVKNITEGGQEQKFNLNSSRRVINLNPGKYLVMATTKQNEKFQKLITYPIPGFDGGTGLTIDIKFSDKGETR